MPAGQGWQWLQYTQVPVIFCIPYYISGVKFSELSLKCRILHILSQVYSKLDANLVDLSIIIETFLRWISVFSISKSFSQYEYLDGKDDRLAVRKNNRSSRLEQIKFIFCQKDNII